MSVEVQGNNNSISNGKSRSIYFITRALSRKLQSDVAYWPGFRNIIDVLFLLVGRRNFPTNVKTVTFLHDWPSLQPRTRCDVKRDWNYQGVQGQGLTYVTAHKLVACCSSVYCSSSFSQLMARKYSRTQQQVHASSSFTVSQRVGCF